jgi:hypothetical protein
MATSTRKFKFSGLIADDDLLHSVSNTPSHTIAPTCVWVPGVGCVPQYAPTVSTPVAGYNPAQDCNGNFMSYKFQPNNNCYNYSTNMATSSFAQPGRKNGYLLPPNFTGADVQAGAEKDGLVRVGSGLSDLQAHAAANGASGHYVALMVSSPDPTVDWPGDYHWARSDDSTIASWSQKDGNDQVTNFDFAGNPITNPATANWTVNQGPDPKLGNAEAIVTYDFYCFMWVPWGNIDII